MAKKERIVSKRKSIVISNTLTFTEKGVYVCNEQTIFKLLEKLNSNNIWIISGKQIYQLFMKYVNTIYLTRINKEYECNLF